MLAGDCSAIMDWQPSNLEVTNRAWRQSWNANVNPPASVGFAIRSSLSCDYLTCQHMVWYIFVASLIFGVSVSRCSFAIQKSTDGKNHLAADLSSNLHFITISEYNDRGTISSRTTFNVFLWQLLVYSTQFGQFWRKHLSINSDFVSSVFSIYSLISFWTTPLSLYYYCRMYQSCSILQSSTRISITMWFYYLLFINH